MSSTDKPLPFAVVARRLGLPVEWVKAEALGGRLPCLRIGRRIWLVEKAVRAELTARASAPPANGARS